MRNYYGNPCPNGLRYLLFTGCRKCWAHVTFITAPEGFAYPDPSNHWWSRAAPIAICAAPRPGIGIRF
jgi:hypothetical protein